MVKSIAKRRSTGGRGNLLVPAGPGGAVSPGVEGSRDSQNGQELTYRVMGDQVFAILYRKVKLRFLSRRKVGMMALEVDNRWKTCWDWREYESQDEDDKEDIAEATLTDSDLDISDDEYLSEDEIGPLLEELSDSPGGEGIAEPAPQTLAGGGGGVLSEGHLEKVDCPEVLVGDKENNREGYEDYGGQIGTSTSIEKEGLERISERPVGIYIMRQKEILNWLKVGLCYGILIYLFCCAWSNFGDYFWSLSVWCSRKI